MQQLELQIDAVTFSLLQRHLAAKNGESEEAAFLYCRELKTAGMITLTAIDILLLEPEAFVRQSRMYLELRDETRAFLIKKAHDLKCSLVEIHSHPGQRVAEFSWSDLSGFEEFVPHVRWRLKGRPYVAVVCGAKTFDALVWQGDSNAPTELAGIRVENHVLTPTGKTFSALGTTNER